MKSCHSVLLHLFNTNQASALTGRVHCWNYDLVTCLRLNIIFRSHLENCFHMAPLSSWTGDSSIYVSSNKRIFCFQLLHLNPCAFIAVWFPCFQMEEVLRWLSEAWCAYKCVRDTCCCLYSSWQSSVLPKLLRVTGSGLVFPLLFLNRTTYRVPVNPRDSFFFVF